MALSYSMVSGMSRLGCGFLQPNKHDEQITVVIIIVRGCVGLPKRRQPNLVSLQSKGENCYIV